MWLGANNRSYASAAPALGAHGSDFQIDGSGTSPSSVTRTTQVSGSSTLAFEAGEFTNIAASTDNKGNGTYGLLQTSGYASGLWAGFGANLRGKANAAGGSSHTVQFTKTTAVNESTLIVVEVRGTTIRDSSVVARAAAGAGATLTSASVTTTRAAMLVAFWTGDGGVGTADQTFNFAAGWTLIESLFLGGTAYVQAACAVKQVSSAGTYTFSGAPVANQGAIMMLAAVEA